MSNRILELLPDVETIKSSMKAMAILDAILSPDWEYRYYSFDATWGEGENMASMRGSDHLLPAKFRDFFSQPAFLPEETSFCIWNMKQEK